MFSVSSFSFSFFFFFFNDTATTEIYTLSLHDALPICPLHCVEGAPPPRALAPPASSAGAGQQLRVALSRRSPAHGRQPLRPLRAARLGGDRRSLPGSAPLDATGDARWLRLRARDRRRPLAARLRRAARRQQGSDRHRLPRARARLLRGPGNQAEAADDRQRLQLRPQRLAARAARPPRDPAFDHPSLPAAHQRQGRALPPDDGPRVGLRPRLPVTSTAQPSAATLARLLQPATAPQLARRPTSVQPR